MQLKIKTQFELPTTSEIIFGKLPKIFLLIYVTYLFTFNYALDVSGTIKAIINLLAVIFFGALAIFRLKCIFMGVFEKSFLAFLAACVLSIFFAIDSSEAAYRCYALFFIFLLTMFLHAYLRKCDALEFFIFVLCFAGIFLAAYNFYFYGVGTYLSALGSKRLGVEIMNVNTIGRFCSLATIICFWYAYYKRKFYYLAPMILCAIVSLGVGSRKAVVFLIFGCCLLYLLKGDISQKLKNVVLIIISLAAFVLILQLPMFDRTQERFLSFLALFTGDEPIDHSTAIRLALIEGGWNDFLASPLMGVGVDNSHFLARRYIGDDYYMHNNFIELLVSVGLIGTIPFYFLRIYPIIKLLRPALNHDETAILFESLLIIFLILDFGQNSYLGTETYLYTLAAYVKISKLREARS